MPSRSTSRDPEALLLELCRAVAALQDGRRMQWIGHGDVHERLPQLSIDQLDAAIAVARERGWLNVGGEPDPLSVVLTADGWRAIG